MVFRDLQGKELTIKEILKKREEENGVSILTKKTCMRRVHKSNTLAKECSKCSFPVMEYKLEYNRETILYLGCPYCSATERIADEEMIIILLNREEEGKGTQPPLFNEVMV